MNITGPDIVRGSHYFSIIDGFFDFAGIDWDAVENGEINFRPKKRWPWSIEFQVKGGCALSDDQLSVLRFLESSGPELEQRLRNVLRSSISDWLVFPQSDEELDCMIDMITFSVPLNFGSKGCFVWQYVPVRTSERLVGDFYCTLDSLGDLQVVDYEASGRYFW